MWIDIDTKSGSVSKQVPEEGWIHNGNRSTGVLSERKYPFGVRVWRILIPVLCAIWCCEE